MTDNRDDKTRLVTGGKSTGNASNSDRKASGNASGKPSKGPAKNDDATVIAGGPTSDKSTRNPDATLVTSQTPLSTPTSSRTGSTTTGGTTPRVSALNNKVIKGRFELVSMLGAGGMGAVYKALDRRKVEASDSDPYVAVKLLNDDFRQHPDAFISLQRESRKSQTLAHPNIVTVYDFDRDRDTVFMTMEFLEGAPLDELLREHPNGLPPEQAESALRDISNALIYAHSHNIIHSDFKPGNIYVTKNKGSKVFDFGIARAVSEGSAAHGAGEKTIFDAGTLGALTPAYASYEMLKGAEPAESDDLYALGCVAYELYSGKHPFNKTPADQALTKKLKPKRIKGLSRRQWNALSGALELKRENRTQTVDEFYKQFFGKARMLIWALAASVTAFIIGGGVYYQQYQEQLIAQAQLKVQLEEELAQKLEDSAITNQTQKIEQLVQIAALTPKWDMELRRELLNYENLVSNIDGLNTDELNESVRQRVISAYIKEAKQRIADNNLENVLSLLQYASRWEAPADQIELLTNQVLTNQEAERLRQENERLAAAKKEADLLRLEQEKREKELEEARQIRIRQEVAALEKSLRCPNQIDVAGDVASHLKALESLDPGRSADLRTIVANSLTNCFNKLAAVSPFAADTMLTEARELLPSQGQLDPLVVDYCSHLEPGTGAKGRRYTCADPLPRDALGPTMVVVPAPDGGRPIAISQYEITYDDVADYCTVSQLCDTDKYARNFMPIHNIKVDFAENFAGWLSSVTGHYYRLPTYDEWLTAATADGAAEFPERNCFLKYGAIEKGLELHKTTNGKQNSYGLASHVGNVQEWAYRDNKLVAAGGSRQTPLNECRYSTVTAHNGTADEFTGFRLVRELAR